MNETSTIRHAILVYQSVRKPYKSKCVYLDDCVEGLDKKKWRFVASIEPAQWIEYLLNVSGERNKHVEGLMG